MTCRDGKAKPRQQGRTDLMQFRGQVFPLGISCVDKGDFSGTTPCFDLCFARESAFRGSVEFVPDEFVYVVTFGESLKFLFFVFVNSSQ